MASNLNVSYTDPVHLQTLIEKFVRIETIDGTHHLGFVYTVDPLTKSYVIVKSTDDTSHEIEMIPGCSVKEVTEIEPPPNSTMVDVNAFLNKGNRDSPKKNVDTMQRKSQVLSWFHKHMVKLEFSPDNCNTLIFKDALSITPPYEVDDCLSSNEIILAKMQEILREMPQDYKPDDNKS